MQISGSQTGMWTAMFLFSYWVVPVGQVPSSGIAETGRESPWPEMILAVTSRTNSGASPGTGGCMCFVLVTLFGHRHLDDALQGPVHGGVVHLNQLLPFLAVGLLDLGLDGPDRFLPGEDPRNDEEGGLHDHVDPRPEADLFGQGDRVDDVELHLLGDELLLHLGRQGIPDGLFGVGRGEQENRPFLGGGEEIILLDERGVVTGDEVGRRDEIRVVQLLRAEAEVGRGHGAGLLRVVDEIPLGKVVRFGAEDLERVLVGPHGAVGAQPEEKAAENVLALHLERSVEGEAGAGHVVLDADGEMVLRGRPGEVVEDGLDHGRE